MDTIINASAATPSFGRTDSSTPTGTSANQFETFLKMLTTQIKNQDPLNPMEGTEFAVQLATFSGVEQQVQTNALLAQLLQGGGGGGLAQLSNWIGRDVRTSAPVWFDQDPLTLEIGELANADGATLITLDAKGNEILRESISIGAGEVEWKGRRSNGETLPAGVYSFRVEGTADGVVVASRDVEAYTRVVGVELVANAPHLILAGGGRSSIEEITALRE